MRKYLPDSIETALGHQKLIRQGVRSTSKGGPNDETKEGHDRTDKPTAITVGRRRRVIAFSTPTDKLKGVIGTDQTGRLPTTSDRGHKYLFLLADVDTDLIHAVPIKSRKSAELIRAFEESYDTLVECGFEPVLHRIDHETSKDLIKTIQERKLHYEIMPPANHRQNPAERAIQTYKSHFISIINGLDDSFPPGAWDLLIPQVNTTLNMLRPCGVNPAHSVYSYTHGPFDFSAHPLAPLGCKAVVHQRRIQNGGTRGGWGNKGKIGYYIGPAMHSYRVWRFYMPETGGIQETDTARFYPKYAIPTISTANQIAESLDTIAEALKAPAPTHTDISENEKLCAVIERLRDIYGITNPTGKQPTNQAVPAPRVNDYTKTKHKQNHRIGTRIKVVEYENGKKKTYLGTAKAYDPSTGLYHVIFDDGEYEEFDNEEMHRFRVITATRRQLPQANHLTIKGFFPKAVKATSPPKLQPLPPKQAVGLFYADDVTQYYGLNAGSIWDEELHRWMAYRDLIKHPNPVIRKRWQNAGINEFGRLAQGYDGSEGLNVVTFIAKSDMPNGKRATYARYVVDYRPEKDEPWRLRITCGGDRLEYSGNTTTHSASMETIKCQLNNIISRPNSKAATCDISNMYLESFLPEAEYVRFHLSLIPEAIVKAYGLRTLATPEGYVYARVNKAWYGLKQAGKIAHDDLVARLATAGYHKNLIEGYFKHESRDIDFTLVVDDFLVRYEKKEDLDHLVQTVRKDYKFKVDEDAKQYVGINLKWDYKRQTVCLSMDGYIEQALREFEHDAPSVPYHAPSKYLPPRYGERIQYATVDDTELLGKDDVTYIQRVVGKLLYYARAIDPTMLHAINDISLSTAKGTEATLKATTHLLNYAHTHPSTEIIYRASDMILRVESDAAYLVAAEARSRAGGYHYLTNKTGTLFNGPVLILAKVIKNVMASAAEAEIGALYMNGQEAVGLRNCLEAMGHKQPPTPMKTDNSTANGIINNTMKQRRSKALDMRFYWIRDRTKQGQFHIYWDAGRNNLADYYTKHHPASLHRLVRPIHTYVQGLSPTTLQGCIEIMNRLQSSKKKNNPNPSGLLAALTAYDEVGDKRRQRRLHNLV